MRGLLKEHQLLGSPMFEGGVQMTMQLPSSKAANGLLSFSVMARAVLNEPGRVQTLLPVHSVQNF
jgi:hypothetical protein